MWNTTINKIKFIVSVRLIFLDLIQPINLILLVVVFSHIDLYIYMPMPNIYLLRELAHGFPVLILLSETICLLKNEGVKWIYMLYMFVVLYCSDLGSLGWKNTQGVSKSSSYHQSFIVNKPSLIKYMLHVCVKALMISESLCLIHLPYNSIGRWRYCISL